MIYEEKKANIFKLCDERYYLAHCISADAKLGAGIAVQFEKEFNLRQDLLPMTPIPYPSCIQIGRVFNLVTKSRYSDKPTLSSLQNAVIQMRILAVKENVTKIAMPKIGCGLDRLSWINVKPIILGTFADTNIEILICYI